MEFCKVTVFFTYRFRLYGTDGQLRDAWENTNLIPDAGRDYIINAALNGGSQYTNWYIGLFSVNRTPVAADTLSTLLGDAPEVTTYSAATRIELADDPLVDGLWSNIGAPALFEFTAPANVWGGFITSSATKSSTSGLLLSAEVNPTVKPVGSGEKLEVSAGLAFITI